MKKVIKFCSWDIILALCAELSPCCEDDDVSIVGVWIPIEDDISECNKGSWIEFENDETLIIYIFL